MHSHTHLRSQYSANRTVVQVQFLGLFGNFVTIPFSKRSDLLIISLKITLAGFLIVGGIYFLEKYMMDIDNQKILWDLGLIIINCFIISGVFL